MTSTTQAIELPTGVTLEYREQGSPGSTCLLLLHGLSDSCHSFDLVLSHLPSSIHAFALTQRGHGDARRPASAYRYQDFAADVAAFLDALQLNAAVIVGHSMGSTIAQRFALDYPERTLGLVLIASFANLAQSQAPKELWPVVSTMDDPVDPDFVREFQESTIARPVPEAFFETAVEESRKLPARVWRDIVATSLEDDFSAELKNIKAPTLLIWGDRDEMVSGEEQGAQTAAIANAQLVIYHGAGHAVPWEEPERVASDLVSFVETAVA